MYTPSRPWPRRAASARDQAARLDRRARRPRCGDESSSGSGGVGTLERRELLDQPRDPLRVGLLVDAVERRHAACARAARPPARWRGSSAARSAGGPRSAATARAPTTSPSASKLELGLERLDLERRHAAAARPAPPPRARASASGSATGSGGGSRAGEDLVELVVVEARVGADQAAVEARRAAARRPRRARSRPSPRAARRPGARLQASSLSAAGSIGSTAPGT